jgi:hypothetical protein
MNYRFFLSFNLLVFVFVFSLNAQKLQLPKLSNDAFFSLITCTPGNEVYNQFGHSAIRLKDDKLGLDFVYNYGTFNYETPNFILKFIERKLMYTLSKSSFIPFLNSFVQEGRGVAEQKIRLDSVQRQKLFEILETNYLPQNREYLYDFFYDNCASKIRDVIATTGKLKIDETKSKKTFRHFLDEYISHDPWLNFGIDLILGLEADKICNKELQMFLPDYLSSNLENASLNNEKLMENTVWILPKPAKKSINQTFTPFFLSCSLLSLSLLLFFTKKLRILAIYEIILLSCFFLAGLFLMFMWFGTDHIATHKNLNILWANPLYILWIISAYRKNISKFAKYSAYLLLVSNAIVLFMFLIPIQEFNYAVLPMLLLSTIALCRILFINTLNNEL